MPTTDTEVSRLKLDHPDLGHDGGALLHGKVRTAWTKIGDMMNGRFFIEDALADTASVDFDHNFKDAFNNLEKILYLRNTGTGELTLLTSETTPKLSDFTIAATPGSLTTQTRVTNNSGAARDIAILIKHGRPRVYHDYDAVVGDSPGSTHSTLAAAIADTTIVAGSRILVTKSETLNSTITLDKASIEIVFKPGVTFSKGTATTGLDIGANANRTKIRGGRWLDFSTGGDVAINVNAGAVYVMLRDILFDNNDTDIEDNSNTTLSSTGHIVES